MSLPLPAPKTLAELAELVGGKADGDPACPITGVAGLGEAGPGDLAFLSNPKYAEAAAVSKAGCLLLPASGGEFRCEAKNRIYVEDPQYAFSLVLASIESLRPKLQPVIDPKSQIHYQSKMGPGVSVGAFTVIERGVLVGEGTVIGPQCYLGENVRVGRHCRIYPQVVLREDCLIGDRVIIHSGTVLGADGFGFSTDRKTGRHRKIPQLGNVIIKDEVEIGANVTIDRATIGSTTIGPGTKIDNLVQVAHNVKIGQDGLIVSQAGIAGSCVLGERVTLAGQAGLAGHLAIGDGAIIMAQTGVMADVEKNKMMFGYPARPRQEAFRLQVLYGKLPEIYEELKALKKSLAEAQAPKAPAPEG